MADSSTESGLLRILDPGKALEFIDKNPLLAHKGSWNACDLDPLLPQELIFAKKFSGQTMSLLWISKCARGLPTPNDLWLPYIEKCIIGKCGELDNSAEIAMNLEHRGLSACDVWWRRAEFNGDALGERGSMIYSDKICSFAPILKSMGLFEGHLGLPLDKPVKALVLLGHAPVDNEKFYQRYWSKSLDDSDVIPKFFVWTFSEPIALDEDGERILRLLEPKNPSLRGKLLHVDLLHPRAWAYDKKKSFFNHGGWMQPSPLDPSMMQGVEASSLEEAAMKLTIMMSSHPDTEDSGLDILGLNCLEGQARDEEILTPWLLKNPGMKTPRTTTLPREWWEDCQVL